MFIFLFLILSLFFPKSVSAHAVGQPPFFEVNGQYAGYYSVPVSSTFFTIPQDQSPQNYLVGVPLNLTIDPIPLGVPMDIVKKSRFLWDFGDGIHGSGLNNVHTYIKPGTYIIDITASFGSDEPTLIESDIVQILPDSSYQLPQIILQLDHHTVSPQKNLSIDLSLPHHLDVSQSTGAAPITVSWDLGDQNSASGSIVDHKFAQNGQVIIPVVRVTDTNGFYSDSYLQIIAGGTSPPTPTPIPPSQYFTPRTNTLSRNPLTNLSLHLYDSVFRSQAMLILCLTLILLGGLHALTPGHGKSIMAAYLVGHPGHSYRDVFLLAATITITHTGLIYILGFIFLYFDHTHTLASILPYFQKFGNYLIIILGLWLMWRGIKELIHHRRHEHHHDHLHQNHSSLFLAGVSGGLVPCPDAFAIFIFFTSKGQISFALISIVLFSLGLSATIVGIGLALLFGKRTFNLEDRLGSLVETYIPLTVGLILICIVLFTSR